MRIGFVWTGFTSYMADCWRELASRPGVELKIWIEEQRKSDTAFDVKNVMRGLDFGWDYSDQITDVELRIAESEIKGFRPDILFVCGWARNLPPFVARSEALKDIPKILCCDMPWEWRPRKFVARFVLWRHLRRFKKIMVPGVRAARYARWLGFKREDIILGEYGIDVTRFSKYRIQTGSHRGFVFAGRLVKAKGIRTLAAAYSRYREMVTRGGEPWNLDVYGVGPEKKWLDGIEGVSIHGFAQPNDIATTFCKAGAFVITSHWDPWPLVMLESCAAGLPIVCTDRCWNRYELVKGNGIVVKSGDVEEMAKAMVRVAHGECNGECGQILSLPYSCPKWTERIIKHCKEIVR